MNYRYKSLDEVSKELKNQLRKLNAQSKRISSKINRMSASDEGIRKTLRYESEIMTATTGKARLLPNSQHQLVYSFSRITQFLISEIDNNRITARNMEKNLLLFNKVAELSYRLEVLCKDSKGQFILFENIRNLIRNLVGILLGDKYINFNQMTIPAFHITFDFKTRDREHITDKEFIRRFIIKTIKSIKMSILHGPNLMEGSPKNPGITGFAVVDFSHIAIHTFILPHSLENEVFIDIFSCKPYDKRKVVASIKQTFHVEKNKVNYEVLSFGE